MQASAPLPFSSLFKISPGASAISRHGIHQKKSRQKPLAVQISPGSATSPNEAAAFCFLLPGLPK